VAGEGLITEKNFFILRTPSLKALTGTRKPPLGAGLFLFSLLVFGAGARSHLLPIA
jgi:hypothetical protein